MGYLSVIAPAMRALRLRRLSSCVSARKRLYDDLEGDKRWLAVAQRA